MPDEELQLGEEAALVDEIKDQDIEDLLNGVFDPFHEEDLKELTVLDNQMALEGIKMLREDESGQKKDTLIKAIDTNQLVTQAIRKQ
jgi:hypothetical protein